MTNYHEPFIPEYRGNPLIEALPEILDDKFVIRKLGEFPSYDESEREWKSFQRRHATARLHRLRSPFPDYLAVFRMIERALYESYLPKNPLSPTTANWLHHLNNVDSGYIPKTGLFQANAQGMTLIGISGLGKTSMVLQIMSYFGEVIQHEIYKGKPLKFIQVPMIYVKCSHDTTLATFCESIIRQLQQRMGLPQKLASTIGRMINQIQTLTRISFLGMLVVDDLQNMSVAKTGGRENFINFLLNLIDESGVPILFISNPEAKSILQEKFRVARRAEKLGYIEISSLTKKVWDKCVIDALWRYQWTKIETKCTPELNELLFKLSRGIIDIAIRIYIQAQNIVIGTNDETITTAVLEQAFSKTCLLTESGLILLDQASEESDDLSDYCPPATNVIRLPENSETNIPETENGSIGKITNQIDLKKIIGDLNRIHHPEFNLALTKLINSESLSNNVKDFEALRKCRTKSDRFQALTDSNYIATDPLNLITDG